MRILILYPDEQMHGGAELVAAWIVQALRAEHELTILAWNQLELPEINRACGTSIATTDYRLIMPPRPLRRLEKTVRAAGLDPYKHHRYGYLMRAARRLRSRWDLVITAFGEADLGGNGIQYVHQPWSYHDRNGRRAGLLDVRRWAWFKLHGYSAERVQGNLTLVNSAWTAAKVERELGVRSRVLFPPAPGKVPATRWEDRGQRVISVGRLGPYKRFEEVIEIVARARVNQVELSLDIAGLPDPNHSQYLVALRRRVAELPWVTLHEGPGRERLLELLAGARYGLHAFRDEPFGIAVAEMVRAGCLPLAFRGGGPPEILGTDELLFETVDEAAEKLLKLTRSAEDQARLRAALAARAPAFSESEFVRQIREIVTEVGPTSPA